MPPPNRSENGRGSKPFNLDPEEQEAVEASEVSPDLGSLQMLKEKPGLPFFRVRADQTYNWLSNANYARNSFNVVAAWQAISSLEAAWAPTFSTMPGYEKFFPEVGVRASFFNYFQQEEPASTFPQSSNQNGLYDIGLVQDFVLMSLFFRGTKQVTDELSVGLSFDYNGYFYLNSPTDREQSLGAGNAGETNFLNEFNLAYNASFFSSLHGKSGGGGQLASLLRFDRSHLFHPHRQQPHRDLLRESFRQNFPDAVRLLPLGLLHGCLHRTRHRRLQ